MTGARYKGEGPIDGQKEDEVGLSSSRVVAWMTDLKSHKELSVLGYSCENDGFASTSPGVRRLGRLFRISSLLMPR